MYQRFAELFYFLENFNIIQTYFDFESRIYFSRHIIKKILMTQEVVNPYPTIPTKDCPCCKVYSNKEEFHQICPIHKGQYCKKCYQNNRKCKQCQINMSSIDKGKQSNQDHLNPQINQQGNSAQGQNSVQKSLKGTNETMPAQANNEMIDIDSDREKIKQLQQQIKNINVKRMEADDKSTKKQVQNGKLKKQLNEQRQKIKQLQAEIERANKERQKQKIGLSKQNAIQIRSLQNKIKISQQEKLKKEQNLKKFYQQNLQIQKACFEKSKQMLKESEQKTIKEAEQRIRQYQKKITEDLFKRFQFYRAQDELSLGMKEKIMKKNIQLHLQFLKIDASHEVKSIAKAQDKKSQIINDIFQQLDKMLKQYHDKQPTKIFYINQEEGKQFELCIRLYNLIIKQEPILKSINKKQLEDNLIKIIDKICDNFCEQIQKLPQDQSRVNLKQYQLFQEFLKIHDTIGKELHQLNRLYQNSLDKVFVFLNERSQTFASLINTVNQPLEGDEAVNNCKDTSNNYLKIISIVKGTYHFKKYKQYLSIKDIKLDEAKNTVLLKMEQIQKKYQDNIKNIKKNRIFKDCYQYENLFQKLIIFDQILDKQDIESYKINFNRLYDQTREIVRDIRSDKKYLADNFILYQRINIAQIKPYFDDICHDYEISYRFISRLCDVLQKRTAELKKINANIMIDQVQLNIFKRFYVQFDAIKQIIFSKSQNAFMIYCALDEHTNCFRKIISHICQHLKNKFDILFKKCSNFQNLQENMKEINHYYQYEDFLQKKNQDGHKSFKESIDLAKYQIAQNSAQSAEETGKYFKMLQKICSNKIQSIDKLRNEPQIPLESFYYSFYSNIIGNFHNDSQEVIEKKLRLSIQSVVNALKDTQWLQGNIKSQKQQDLFHNICKLPSRERTYYISFFQKQQNQAVQFRKALIVDVKKDMGKKNARQIEDYLEECSKNDKQKTKHANLKIKGLQQYFEDLMLNKDPQIKSQHFQAVNSIKLQDQSQNVRKIIKKFQKQFCSGISETSILQNIDHLLKIDGNGVQQSKDLIANLENAFKICSMSLEKLNGSLLEQRDKNQLYKKIGSIRQKLKFKVEQIYQGIDYKNFLINNCSPKNYFTQLIMIQTVISITENFNNTCLKSGQLIPLPSYKVITDHINNKIEQLIHQTNTFAFYDENVNSNYNQNYIEQHLIKVQARFELFRLFHIQLGKFQDFRKSNYLQKLNVDKLQEKKILTIIENTWIKQISKAKSEIQQIFNGKNNSGDLLKYKIILEEINIIKKKKLTVFNEVIKENYDFLPLIKEKLNQSKSEVDKLFLQLDSVKSEINSKINDLQMKIKVKLMTEKQAIEIKYQQQCIILQTAYMNEPDQNLRQLRRQSERVSLKKDIDQKIKRIGQEQKIKIQNLNKNQEEQSKNIIDKVLQIVKNVKYSQQKFGFGLQIQYQKFYLCFNDNLKRRQKSIKKTFVHHLKANNDFQCILTVKQIKVFNDLINIEWANLTKETNNVDAIVDKIPQLKTKPDVKKKLKEAFNEYKTELTRIQDKFQQKRSIDFLDQLIQDTIKDIKSLAPSIAIARIFAVYAIKKQKDQDNEQCSFWGNPHASQVVAILLQIDAQNGKSASIKNTFVEVKTGQGKSRVLGGLCCYLAIHGFKIMCGCYSSYLSKRDYDEFSFLFKLFKVQDKIQYNTFSQLSQALLNEGQFRFKQIIKDILINKSLTRQQQQFLERLSKLLKKKNNQTKAVLVVDQVDVFFDSKYFGNIYNLGVALDGPQVQSLLKYVWLNKNDSRLCSSIFNTSQYNNLVNAFPHLENLLQNQVYQIIQAPQSYNDHQYQIIGKEILYIQNDSVNKKLNYGLSTAFAACFEFFNGTISEENFKKHACIGLIAGQYSYAEFPQYFKHILGVSGTIQAMSDFQKQVISKKYEINQLYTLPSIYGDNHRKIKGYRCFDHFDQLAQNILKVSHEMFSQKRPLLIFFETQEEIMAFYKFKDQFPCIFNKITENMPSHMRDPQIIDAGRQGRQTLITSAFSRGTDCNVYDKKINQIGGMHVIQTYISSGESQQIQIMGRTARQGKNGSYELMTIQSKLQCKKISRVADSNLKSQIEKSWITNAKNQGVILQKKVDQALKLHQKTVSIVENSLSSNSSLVKQIIGLNYQQVTVQKGEVTNIIAIDGTVSMSACLRLVLDVVGQSIRNTGQIINAKQPNGRYKHKIIIFRNYSSGQQIIEQSNYSDQEAILKGFLSTIHASGGMGNQAHEALFYEIGNLNAQEKISQIFMIGDACGNTLAQIRSKRRRGQDQAYWNQKIPVMQPEKYLQPILVNQIPIHSFYIGSTYSYFNQLSRKTKGQCHNLDVNNRSNALKLLTDKISECVLQLIGGAALVQQYRTRFGNAIYI